MAALSSIHHLRLRRFARSLTASGIDSALIGYSPNLRYLCGFTGSSGVLAFAAGTIVFFSDGRYLQQAKQEVRGAKIKIDPLPRNAALTWLKEKKIKRLGVEAANIPAADWALIQQTLRLPAKLRDAGKLLSEQRMIKDHSEQNLIRHAARLGSSLFPKALESLRPGTSENEV